MYVKEFVCTNGGMIGEGKIPDDQCVQVRHVIRNIYYISTDTTYCVYIAYSVIKLACTNAPMWYCIVFSECVHPQL